MNNISDLIKKRPQFTYLTKGGDDDFFVYNKIIKNEKTNNMSTQDNNKKSSNQITSNLDNGFIMETSQSKGSNKDGNIQRVNSINYKQHKLSQKIEKMITMNNKINSHQETNNASSKQVKFTCCLTNNKK